MKQSWRWKRIAILYLLSLSVFCPLILLSERLKHVVFLGKKEFVEDLPSIYRRDGETLSVVETEEDEGLKEPDLVVYRDGSKENPNSNISSGFTADLLGKNGTEHKVKEENKQNPQKKLATTSGGKQEQSSLTKVQHDQSIRSQPQRVTDEKIKQIRDQVIRAKAYLNLAPPSSNSHLVKELRLRIKELERAVGEATKDSDLSRSALQRMRTMEASLSKASHIYTDCSALVSKLRAMTNRVEEQVRAQKSQATYLVELAGRTTPKGFHCLTMRLTAEYFALQPEEQNFPNQEKLNDGNLYHYAVFSDNVLACAVVVKSTISNAMDPEKIVFHVVTDSLNHPAMLMWFLLNPPGEATIQIQSVEKFEWLAAKYNSTLKKQNSHDSRYTSALNHLRFYLPDVFPQLDKIVLLDHDVVVQRDLSRLWSVDMKGKVNGAVETCQEVEPSFHRMDMFINFSDPMVAERFDAKTCTWAFGMNLFDLHEWRRQNLTAVYHKYLQMGLENPLWKAGSLPLGWVTFYKRTVALDRRWHALGLGYESGVGRSQIERAAVIQYDGVMKPWLEIGISKYKGYWSKHLNYGHPLLQQCNIHE
ncbi:probable galacturonosyltransferase 6 isoform X3 [Vitis vinifera]|uniref:probable galacturonosyltransferase 6 isoform X3 n=1 Tax=Vitis vinifera TaxID=29760 RepID=UPI00053F4CDA|nr:probable galacturonosyltransferase 6 isoform X3 [Vitis vinifera]|eukprot:XP_010651938.1 PREDICTED: probable galacturonosyltransferase 6 isoform X3 [Vitis vinifera]